MPSSQIKLKEAIALHQQGQLAPAKNICEIIIMTEPNHHEALHLLAVIECGANHLQRAIELMDRAININPTQAVYYFTRGKALQALTRFEAAIENYDDAISVKPDFTLAYFNRGNALQKLMRLEAAVASYDQAIVFNPNLVDAHVNRGNTLQKLLQFDAAITSYDRAIAINTNAAEAYVNRGNALQKLMRLEEAMANYDRAIAITPNYATAFYNRGLALQALQQLDAAIKNYDRAINIKPDFAYAYFNRGNTQQTLMQFKAAVESYDCAIAIQSDFAEAYFNRGFALTELKQYEAALVSYNHVITLKPDYADAYNNHGNALQKLKQYEAAIEDYCKAIDIDNTNKIYWNNFSTCLTKIKLSQHHDHIIDYVLKLLSQKTIVRPLIILPIVLKILSYNQNIVQFLDIDSHLKNKSAIHNIIKYLVTVPLFVSILKLASIADARYENSLKIIRKFILENINSMEEDKKILTFQYALAQQCFINEYVYFQSDEETNLVSELGKAVEDTLNKNEKLDILKIITLGTYKPLHYYPWANRLIGLDDSEEYETLIKLQILEPHEDQMIRTSIPLLSPIENSISQAVQTQYELNPYPRWLATQIIYTPINIKELFDDIKLNPELSTLPFSDSLEILIAGCGTGQHALSTASRFKNANVTAIDLSLSSLSYAIRKTREFHIANIRYLQADILDLKKLNKQFDIVESAGVLHHMSNPVEGWKVLVDCTKTGGLMKIALYSDIARKNIIMARTLIKHRNLSGTSKDIRFFRNELLNSHDNDFSLLKNMLSINDFYSTSECRDLLFHVQEHRFNLIQIEEIINSLGLTFLGFELQNDDTRSAFKQQIPNGSEYSLLDWHTFELANPKTFTGMYQFWLKK